MRLNCRDSAAASKLPWSAGKRALHVRDLVNFRQIYHWGTGSRERMVEEPPGQFDAPPPDLEEGASHHK